MKVEPEAGSSDNLERTASGGGITSHFDLEIKCLDRQAQLALLKKEDADLNRGIAKHTNKTKECLARCAHLLRSGERQLLPVTERSAEDRRLPVIDSLQR